jgi:hypothetical protein
MALFGKSKKDEARQKAQAEYEAACSADVASRTGHSLTIRAGARAKVHVDKLFVNGAEIAMAYDEARSVAIALGEDRPDLPKPSEYQTIKSVNGDIVSYLPAAYCERIFRLGMRYQTMEISADQAVEMVQLVADQISLELQLEKPFVALEFLREELKDSPDASSATEGDQGDRE